MVRGARGARAGLGLLPALLEVVVATCRLPIDFPSGAELSGATVGPADSVVIASGTGTILFADLTDFSVREDTALNDKYIDSYGWFNLQGIAMVNPESTYMYLGMENQPAVIEYEWHESHKIFRKFTLEPGFEHSRDAGIQSLTWVPTDASTHQGYFYIGSRLNGHVFVYELPLLEDTGPEASATLRSVWVPAEAQGNRQIAGLSHSGGYLFVNYDDGNSNHVLIYPVLSNGLPGDLVEQYEVDVEDAQGMAVRKTTNERFEVFFTSNKQRSVLVYTFRFETGFELHGRCAGILAEARQNGASALSPSCALIWAVPLLLALAHAYEGPIRELGQGARW